ncbi:MAG: maleylacetoacetate isomerase [Alphaproteobacteria bacterium]|jgi:maleylacetoacetate isomerase
MLKLHDFWRSSAAYRVRIALNLKGLEAERTFVHLRKDGGQQKLPAYKSVNPQGLVPTLETDGGPIPQSMAILEYLDECHPAPPFLPTDAYARARVRGIADAIACDIHPINNLRILLHLSDALGQDEASVNTWYRHWVAEGLAGLEAELAPNPGGGQYCWGDTVTMADICLVPQIYNARRYDCDLAPYPTLVAINDRLNAIPAFADAAPENQPDAA